MRAARTAVEAPSSRADRDRAVPERVTRPGGEPARVQISRRWLAVAAVVVVALVAGAAIAASRLVGHPRAAAPVVAVGYIRDYTGADTAGVGRPVPDMLATNLARVPNLRVVSNARIYELLGQFGNAAPSATTLTRAAREAGATELVEGALYDTQGRGLRLDLRLVDLDTGAVRGAYEVQGADPFTLVDRATAQLAAGFDLRADSLRVADVTTKSFLAYRLYERGLRALWEDLGLARRYFEMALREDSTFALAAYYAWRTEDIAGESELALEHLSQAMRMADRATDRERLLIRGTWAFVSEDPARIAIAETLAIRYPTEPDGHLLLGRSLLWGGDFLAPYVSSSGGSEARGIRSP
jgi:TolB-like protein